MTYSRPVPVVMCALLGLILAPASRTLAVDGVIEINQARAVQGASPRVTRPAFPSPFRPVMFAYGPMSFRLT